MVVDIKFEIQWWERLHRSLDILDKELDDMQPFYKEAIDVVEKSVDKNFDRQWTVETWKWKELAVSTKKARKKRWWYYKQQPITTWKKLIWTWTLKNSRKKTINKIKWVFELTAYYAKYHQWGNNKRKLIELDHKTNAEIARSAQKVINDKIWIANLR